MRVWVISKSVLDCEQNENQKSGDGCLLQFHVTVTWSHSGDHGNSSTLDVLLQLWAWHTWIYNQELIHRKSTNSCSLHHWYIVFWIRIKWMLIHHQNLESLLYYRNVDIIEWFIADDEGWWWWWWWTALKDDKHLSACCGNGLGSKRPSRNAYVKVLMMHFIRGCA